MNRKGQFNVSTTLYADVYTVALLLLLSLQLSDDATISRDLRRLQRSRGHSEMSAFPPFIR